MKAVHFGAGNIGRGFIGLLLSKSGYEVTFVDVNDTLVNLLQSKRQYTVTLANEQADSIVVDNVTAIDGKDQALVAEAVAEADIVTTAVGVSVLKHIAAAIAQGIELRLSRSTRPLHVIACENAIGGSTQLKNHVYDHLSAPAKSRPIGRSISPMPPWIGSYRCSSMRTRCSSRSSLLRMDGRPVGHSRGIPGNRRRPLCRPIAALYRAQAFHREYRALYRCLSWLSERLRDHPGSDERSRSRRRG